jgi:hypothetical protein
METLSSLLIRKLTAGPYSEPAESSSHPHDVVYGIEFYLNHSSIFVLTFKAAPSHDLF